jgi:hypothetical protein
LKKVVVLARGTLGAESCGVIGAGHAVELGGADGARASYGISIKAFRTERPTHL